LGLIAAYSELGCRHSDSTTDVAQRSNREMSTPPIDSFDNKAHFIDLLY